MIVTGYNPSTTDLEKTYISSYTAKGATLLPVKNNDRFTVGCRVLLGRMSDERSEIVTVSAVNTNKIQITVGATQFDHNADDPVTLLQWDKIRFYRSDSEAGTYTLQHTQDIDVDNLEDATRWDDLTALESHFYKVSYYDSVTTNESQLSDAIQASGYPTKSAGKIIDIHVRRVRDTEYNVLGPDEYLDVMNEVGNDLTTQAHRPYRFLRKRVALNTVAGQNWIAMPDNLWKFNDANVASVLGTFSRFSDRAPLDIEDFYDRYDSTQTGLNPQDNILNFALDEENRRIMIYPTPKTSQTGVFKLRYYKTFDTIKSMGQLVETPNNLVYLYKLRAEFYWARAESDQQWRAHAMNWDTKYGNEVMKMQRTNRIDTGTARSLVSRRFRKRRRYHL